jgi:hypothetical protein
LTNHSQKNPSLVEWLKVKALSSSSSIVKQKKRISDIHSLNLISIHASLVSKMFPVLKIGGN